MKQLSGVKLLAGMFLVLVSGTASAEREGKAYLVSFQIETYLPITAKDIASAVRQPCVLMSKGVIKDIVAAAKPTDQLFNSYRVRARIDEGDETLFIDGDGILHSGGKTLVVDEEDMKSAVRKHSKCKLIR